MNTVNFIPSVNNKKHLHFQCSDNMTLEQITHDVNKYIFEHKNELYLDRTELPIYLKRWVLVRSDTLWDE